MALARSAPARTVYVDGACSESGSGETLACGPSGPIATITDALYAVAAFSGIDPVTIRVRGAHDAFDGVYREYVKLWGTQALHCSADVPCVLEGCPAEVCGSDETPVVSGFFTSSAGWTTAGSGGNAIFSRTVAARGKDTEWGGGEPQNPQEPPDAYFGKGAGAFNPVYLLEGAARSALGFGGSCGGNLVTRCAKDAQCAPGVSCDRTAPPDGSWSLTCTGDPVTSCQIHVNPTGAADPTAGHPIWIPNRNALMVADGRKECPQQESGCLGVSYLTIRRFLLEGARWVALNLQENAITGTPADVSENVRLEGLVVRGAPWAAVRIQRIKNLTIDGLTMEGAARGLSFDTLGGVGLRLTGVRQADMTNVVARHLGNAGRRDPQQLGQSGDLQPCTHCDPPWNAPFATVWASPIEALEIRQSSGVKLGDFEVVDVAGGVHVDAAVNVRLEGGTVRRTTSGIVVDQRTPSASEGFVRSTNVVLRRLRLDENGDQVRGAINLGGRIGVPGACLTPPQAGEYFKIYDNIISHSGLAGILVCENATFCVGGDLSLARCTSDGDCPGGACMPSDGTGQIDVYNNTIWQDRAGFVSSGVLVRNGLVPDGSPAVDQLDVRNNLIAAVAGSAIEVSSGTLARGGVQLDANLYDDPDGDRLCAVRWGDDCFDDLAALRAATPAEPKGVEGDPAFANRFAVPPDLHISALSAARDAGVMLGTDYNRDFDRQTRGEKWDIGADEFRCTIDADCDDGNLCNGVERCFAGFCGAASAVLDCDDHAVCTTDTCKPAFGCLHKPATDGTPCDDEDLCTAQSACQGGRCVGTGAVECPATGVCRLQGACDPDTGVCLDSAPAPDGAACDDGDACTTGDACRGGVCAGPRCDGDPCTQCTPHGCEPVTPGSFDAVACAYRRSLTPPVCDGQHLPPAVKQLYAAAQSMLERVHAGAACAGGKRNVYGRVSVRIIKALRKLDTTQRPRARTRLGRLSADCFSALRAVLSDARRRAQTASAACTQ